VLKKYRPTKIFVSSPADTNRDHRALNLFLQVALWDLQDELPPPAVYSYLIHCYGWPRPSNYHPDLYLHIPKKFARSQVQWRTLDLSPEEEELKHQAIRLYRSQCSDSAFYLVSFARKNELFGRYPDIELEKANGSRDFEIATTYEDKTVAYCRMEGNLFINVFLRREGVGFRRLFVNIAGYRRGVAFARMPKLKIIVSPLGVKLLDRGKFIDARCISVEEKKHSMSIRVPLAALGDPSYLLSSVNTYREDYSTDLNAWRVIKLK
ncbi:MAG: hypothetical protein WCG78_08535, partial [Candidatus Omnitrophota bacterium]